MMRSRKTAAVIYTLCLVLTGIGTTAKSAPMVNLLTAIHANYQPEAINDLEPTKQNEIICLALNQYHEARGAGIADIMAVGFSTRNRMSKLAKSYCSTIFARGQYTWTKRSTKSLLPKEKGSWLHLVDVARQIVTQDDLNDPTRGADSFFARRLRPSWAKHSDLHLRIGPHMFVRMFQSRPISTTIIPLPPTTVAVVTPDNSALIETTNTSLPAVIISPTKPKMFSVKVPNIMRPAAEPPSTTAGTPPEGKNA